MTLLIIALFIVGLLGVVFQIKNETRYEGISNLLLLTVIGATLATQSDSSGQKIIYAFIALAAVNYIFSRINLLQSSYVRLAVPIISVALIFTLFNNESFNYLNAEYNLLNKFIILASIVAVAGVELALLKYKVISALINVGEKDGFVRSLILFFIGAGGFLALFESGPIGIFVIAAVYFSASFFREVSWSFAGQALLVISLISYTQSLSEGNLSLEKADVILGLFVGGFSAMFLNNQLKSKVTWFTSAISHILILTFSSVLLVLHMVYANMGGVDAYCSFMIGFMIVTVTIGDNWIANSIIPMSLAVTILISPHLINEEQDEFESMFEEFGDIDTLNKSDTLETVVGRQVEDTVKVIKEGEQELEQLTEQEEKFIFAAFLGDYNFVPSNSKVLFELGDDGETKGAFKELSGSVSIKEDPQQWKLSVVLDMKDFTTFDEMRDDHLSSEDYFHTDKYSNMTYTASRIVKSGNDWYFDGKFTMLGITKKLKVSVKSSSKDGKRYIMGRGVIDRTLFGMTPSETEGNIVSFNYIAEIK